MAKKKPRLLLLPRLLPQLLLLPLLLHLLLHLLLLRPLHLPPNYGPYADDFAAVFPAVAKVRKVALGDYLLADIATELRYFQADQLHPTAEAQPILLDTVWRRLFPGYVFVEMVMDDDTWHLVKHTNKVTGFVGGAKNRPAPISEEEVQKIVSQMQEGTDKPRHKIEFMVGELVRVKEGPFTDFNGSVEEVNYEKNRLRVSVMIFGRSTPVELEFGQVEKT